VTRGYHLEGLEASGIKSRETEISAVAEPLVYTRVQARQEVIDRVGRPLSNSERRLFMSFGDAVTEEQIAQAVATIAAGMEAAVIPMRAAKA